ncbi:peptidyl-prolyl cis-trans isomerase sig-7 [Chrysoperla carnea]|uniref:peptidyl-prolyl cis-trans isomerase sig-7 n=1 Tax=Chrysoperla carnea TaxID=189513 RepID=UPI001D072B15|nr:peptidyl-prolyl cis-trans isomerase sig-7 [Chrysoperla carnea]
MAIVLETTLGDLTIDLFTTERPKACLNFLKLCKMKYYNFNLFHTVQHDFLAQTGDPTGSGTGGESIWGVIDGPLKRYFEGEEQPKIRHTNVGTVSLVGSRNNMLGSQFFITLAPDLVSLDGKHCVIGEVTEGLDILRKINEAICDEEFRPYQDIRITHTVILEDPFPNPERFIEPDQSPEPTAERLQGGRIGADEEIDETVGKTTQELAEMAAEREAKARATILEMVGDIPDAEMAPPENVLFVCKLNPVTTDDDLEIIFSRFGKIKSCEVIRDKQTGDSLQYAFVEFEDKKACEDAYFKMDNVLIDDRRIHVDFSQSVAKVRWMGKGRGVKYLADDNQKINKDIANGIYKETCLTKASKKRLKEETDKRAREDKHSKRKDYYRKDYREHYDSYRNNSTYRHYDRRGGYYNKNNWHNSYSSRYKNYNRRGGGGDSRYNRQYSTDNYYNRNRGYQDRSKRHYDDNHSDRNRKRSGYYDSSDDDRKTRGRDADHFDKPRGKRNYSESSEDDADKKYRKERSYDDKKDHSMSDASDDGHHQKYSKKSDKKFKKGSSEDSDSRSTHSSVNSDHGSKKKHKYSKYKKSTKKHSSDDEHTRSSDAPGGAGGGASSDDDGRRKKHKNKY